MSSPREQRNALYRQVIEQAVPFGAETVKETMRELARNDLFFLLTKVLGREDVNRDWLFDRCMEVQQEPNGYLDLWARGHYKSTIITYAKTIQDLLSNSNLTFGIFSHTTPIAKAFLNQIKTEFETNERLKQLFDDVLYQNPKKESPLWSVDRGIVIKRSGNPKEATVEASGLVDGQPTSKHYSHLIYDDVVTLESVSTPEMISKVTNAFKLSLNLGAENGVIRGIGTRYHYQDTYKTIIENKTLVPRIYKATDDGTPYGRPVMLTQEQLDKKREDFGSFVFACQMLQDPRADDVSGFNVADMRYYKDKPPLAGLNIYILVDPADSKGKKNDYTSMWVVGLGPDRNYYVLDGLRDRLNLTERTNALFSLVQQYYPLNVGYEKYGMQCDIQHIEYVQEEKNYRFNMVEVAGSISKVARIMALVPSFEEHRWFFPEKLLKPTYDGKVIDLIDIFRKKELKDFPLVEHDDMLDCMARILAPELQAMFPLTNTDMSEVSVAKTVY